MEAIHNLVNTPRALRCSLPRSSAQYQRPLLAVTLRMPGGLQRQVQAATIMSRVNMYARADGN